MSMAVPGTSNAVYDDIWWSKGYPVSSGVRIDPAVSISGGKYLTAAFHISLGAKDTPTFLSTDPWRDRIDDASRWNVVFSETRTRLHWLSDGASAILHLCRAYLSPELTPRHGSDEILAEIQHLENKTAYGPEWAFQTLLDPKWCQIPMDVLSMEHKEKTTHKPHSTQNGSKERLIEETATRGNFQGLAEKYYKYLEQAHDGVSRVRLDKDLYIKIPWLNSEVIGLEFMSILRGERCVEPRRFRLSEPAHAWLKLTRQIDCINILGSNFGTLIEPSQHATSPTPQLCAHVARAPQGHDYLVAPLAVLKTIAERKWSSHTKTSV
jgi:hypothetical protein